MNFEHPQNNIIQIEQRKQRFPIFADLFCKFAIISSFATCFLFSALILLAFCTIRQTQFPFVALSALFIALPVVSLSWSLRIFIFLLPFFGNRPGTNQIQYLLLLTSSLNVGFILSLLSKKRRNLVCNLHYSNPLIFLSVCYLTISALSLCSLPIYNLITDATSQIYSWTSWSAASYWLLSFAGNSEEKLGYAVLSVLWTSFAFNLMVIAYVLIKQSSDQMIGIAQALLCALVASLLIGIADYYNLINLRFLRGLDPIVNPGDQQFRMQSLFGHSGWFAEYITLCIPFVMLILIQSLKFSLRIAIIVLLLLLGEYCLILSFQRGGWISYPLTLFVIWGAIYVSRRIELGESDFLQALKSSLVKVLISIPITLAISALLLVTLNHSGIVDSEQTAVLSRYVDRFSDIKRTSDRTEFFQAGFMLGKLHPILGGGSESFAYQFEKEFNHPDGSYYQLLNLPLHGSSHNVYMQTFSGKGTVGLLLLLSLLLSTIYYSLKLVLFNKNLHFPQKIVLLICASFGFAFLIYGNVQEIFYVQPLQYITFMVFALAAGVLTPQQYFKNSTRNLILISLGVLILAHLILLTRGTSSGASALNQYGCFANETDAKNRQYSWCSVKAKQKFPIEKKNGKDFVSFNIETGPWKIKDAPGTLQIKLADQLIYSSELSPASSKLVSFEVPEQFAQNIQKDGTDPYLVLALETPNYFIPARDFKNTEDYRVLAYKIFHKN